MKNSLKWKLSSPTNTIHLGKTWLEFIQLANFQKSRILWHCCFLPALQKQKHTHWSVRIRGSRRHRLWFKLLVFKHQLLLCRANASLYGNKLLKLGKPEEKKINTSKSKRTRSTSNNHMLPCSHLPRWLILDVWRSHETLSLVFDILPHDFGYQAPVVQKTDNAIHRINLYPADSVIGFPNTYPLDNDLSGG